jgi:nucleotidyltransferase substrate binding protein (TIGR01987 family)
LSDDRSAVIARSLQSATQFLERVLAAPQDDIQQAAAIQAFEFTYELSWKLLQARLRDEGLQVATPRSAFRAAGDAQLIASVERWLVYLDARNLTSHTYNRQTADQVYAVISGGFLADAQALLEGGS